MEDIGIKTKDGNGKIKIIKKYVFAEDRTYEIWLQGIELEVFEKIEKIILNSELTYEQMKIILHCLEVKTLESFVPIKKED